VITNNQDIQYFAVFGDIHGRVTLMYTVALLWQMETGIRLTGILQVGDMGAFPNPLKIDDATRNYSINDPDELDFCNFCKNTKQASQLLNRSDSPPTYFIKGNHEDFEFLNQFNSPTTIDPWNKIHFIPNGEFITLPQSTNVGAFGGIPATIEKNGRGKKLKKKFKKSKFRAISDPKVFTKKSVDNAFFQEEHIDILLTHAGPLCTKLPEGSILLSELSERIKPQIHIFGHHHKAIVSKKEPGNSMLVGLDHFKFDRTLSKIKQGSWGILIKGKKSISFSFSDILESSILGSITYNNYREVIRSTLSHA
jgi:Icc-related predicted phosphoesterase